MQRRLMSPIAVAGAMFLLVLFFRENTGLVWLGVMGGLVSLAYGAWIFQHEFLEPIARLKGLLEQRAAGDKSVRFGFLPKGEIGRILHRLSELDRQEKEEQQRLEHSLDRLNTVFTQMVDGVIIVGRAGWVESANQAALTLFSTAHADAIDGSFAQLVRQHEIIEILQRCVDSQEPQNAVVDMRRNGLFLQVDVTPLIDDGVQGYVVLLHDLTSIRRMETVRRDFISNVSHELRTPLASVRAVIETLQDGALDDRPMAERFLGRAAHEVDSMTQMVSELMELSRIESGKVPLQLLPSPLQEIVDSTVEQLGSHIERKNLQVEIKIPADLPDVLADAQRVRQVLTNLLHNATKFTPDNGRIRINASKNDSEIMVSVRDSGVGIPEEDLPRVFERFYKTDRSRNSGGTGLGLAIAKHIVQAHGGDIWVTSKINRGSVFYFTLPISEDVKAL
ncbi:MAG: sensor histidine kinase [Candidatus Promineifilaceae bacterium]